MENKSKSIYCCPHCGEKTFNPWTKIKAGTMRSNGAVCQNCGRRAVNGFGSTIFNLIIKVIFFIPIIWIYLKAPSFAGTQYDWLDKFEWDINLALLILLIVIPWLANGFFFRLEPAVRVDLKNKEK
ncbi:MAG: hypothetical protein IJ779_07875 [Ruminococcus sp.]|nr:hypothetical protein [Ruminococcus sp.]